jgi:peptidoglycan/LPS O-acetylase OafA/YrhL
MDLIGVGGGHGFSLLSFYLARAKRIVPALLVLCAALMALGWFALPSPDYRMLGTHALASLAFLSNIKFWREAGYFDVASYDKWLLHTWSLAVEWQFYLLLPLGLMLVWRFFPGRSRALWAVAGVLSASLLLSVSLTPNNPSAAFFLLPTRAWEMLAGGVVYLLGAGLVRGAAAQRALEALGFGLILVAMVWADATAWPGYQALLPVLGTCLVLIAGRVQSLWTAPAPLQALGRWSYSIYLWHWPLVVALAYLGMQRQLTAVMLGIMASVALGAISYRWVETPARLGLGHIGQRPAIALLVSTGLLVALPAAALRLANGMPSNRLPPAVELAASEANNFNIRRKDCHATVGEEFRSCIYGGPAVRAVLLGDSHASTVATSVQASLVSPADGVLVMSYTSCPTLFGVKQTRTDLDCAAFNDWAKIQIDALPDTVPLIIVNRSSGYPFQNSHIPGTAITPPSIYFDEPPPAAPGASYLRRYQHHLVASTCELASRRPVYLVRPFPEMTVSVPGATARQLLLGKKADVGITLASYHQRHAFIWAAQDKAAATCGARILNPVPYLCDYSSCDGADAGVPRYYDDNHLSETGNRKLIPMFVDIFSSAAMAAKSQGSQ